MFSSRLFLRSSIAQNLKATLPRRFLSMENVTKTDGNAFMKERAAIKKHAAESSDLWRKLSIYATVPALIVAGVNAYNLWNEHWDHWDHMAPLEERVEYPYQNIRGKNFCWGDGDKTLFWNDKVNYHKHE